MRHRITVVSLSIVIVAGISHAQVDDRSATAANAPTAKATASTISNNLSPDNHTSEDWTTIYLSKSRLPLDAMNGVLLSRVELQGCTRELFRLQWRPNDPIDLYLVRPRGAEKLPVVLFLYNYTSDTDVFRQERWCERALENGFAVVGFPSALSLPRLHTPRPMNQWFVSQLQEALSTSTHDVQMILNYLETRNDLEMTRVGLFGQGSGGAIAILAAAADPRIGVLDLMDPWGDWQNWLRGSQLIPEKERQLYLSPAFLEEVAGLDPVTYLPTLKDRAIRIQQVISDPVTPEPAKDKIAHSIPHPGELARYEDAAAEIKALGSNGVLDWFRQQLNRRPIDDERVVDSSIMTRR